MCVYFNSVYLLYYCKITNTDVQSLRAAGGVRGAIFQRYSFYLLYWYQRTSTSLLALLLPTYKYEARAAGWSTRRDS